MESIGRYRIVGELGRGAMGVVYHATDPVIGRSVAIKTIRIRDINDAEQRDKLRERLFREARSAGVLSHPNIVTIYDMDETDGLAYIAMAYVNGPTLGKILASEAPLSGFNMLRILRQAAAGLDYAHGRGIVHRDVKPGNIMTDEDGAVKITDFGIAKMTPAGNMAGTGMVAGTPNYMSPEQVQGLDVDGRSDQFSLAVIAYEILTGERPFQGEHLSTVVYKIVAEQPAAAERINSTLTPRIDEVLRRGLAKKPEDRYPNCSSFVGALEMACAESRGWTTLTASASAAVATAPLERPNLPAQAARRNFGRAPSRPSIMAPLLLSVMVVTGVAGVITWQAGLLPDFLSAFRAGHQEANQTKRVQEPVTAPAPVPVKEHETPVAKIGPPVPEPTVEVAIDKPSPLALTRPGAPENDLKVEAAPVPVKPRQEIVKIPVARLQDLWVSTNPPGAKAVLDDKPGQACQTPCMIHAPTGLHSLTVSQAGYENEYREVRIGDTAQDVPPITLRKPTGTLMLSTNPPGATVRVNGQIMSQVTPAQITLPPGDYSITVEKSGRTQTERVQIRQSPVYLRIPL